MTAQAQTHIPVLAKQTVSLLAPTSGQTVLDCTLGLGGHARLLAQCVGSTGLLVGLDLDSQALVMARETLRGVDPPVRLFQASFSELDAVLDEVGIDRVDVMLADLGVNSTQLDMAGRGFSFTQDGPLDMRMNSEAPVTAADLVNKMGEQELANLIWTFGQERASRRIARRIVEARRERSIATTGALVAVVCRALGVDPDNRRSRIHPATRTFQALRIAVNDEMASLDRLLTLAPGRLRTGGRIGIISFHSLEDRPVKLDFRMRKQQGIYEIVTPRPVVADERECRENPRSRSAKLRVAKRTEQPIK